MTRFTFQKQILLKGHLLTEWASVIKVSRYFHLRMEPLLLDGAFERNNYYRLNNEYSDAIYDEVFQTEVDAALSILRIRLPPLKKEVATALLSKLKSPVKSKIEKELNNITPAA